MREKVILFIHYETKPLCVKSSGGGIHMFACINVDYLLKQTQIGR